MKFVVTQGNIAAQSADCIVVNLFEGVTAPGGATGAVDAALGGMPSAALIASRRHRRARAGRHDAALHRRCKLPAARVLVVGLGKAEKFDAARRTQGRGRRLPRR
jgi:leucyl aminopeptidase